MRKITKRDARSMAMEIVELLCSDDYSEFWNHISVYAGGRKYTSDSSGHPDAKRGVVNGQNVYIAEDYEPDFSRFLPGRDEHILSMTFEGGLSRVIGLEYDMPEFMEKFDAIFKKYGVFYEQLESWNLTCYPA